MKQPTSRIDTEREARRLAAYLEYDLYSECGKPLRPVTELGECEMAIEGWLAERQCDFVLCSPSIGFLMCPVAPPPHIG